MKIKSHFIIVTILSLMSFTQTVGAYAPVESRNFEQYNEDNVNTDAQFVPENSQPVYGNETPRQQQVTTNEPTNQSDMYTQIQRMDQELRELRGQIEVQAHTIKQLQDAQKSQYQDLDQRLANNNQDIPQPGAKAKPGYASTADASMMSKKASEGKLAAKPLKTAKTDSAQNKVTKTEDMIESKSPPSMDEHKLYEQGYNYLKSKQYSQAIPTMKTYLTQYPKGEYAVNAHYWLGELYLLTGSTSEAQKQFLAIVEEFPSAAKVPDSLLKLGTIEADEGQHQKARQQLTRVTKEYPNSPAARIAEQRLKQLTMQGN